MKHINYHKTSVFILMMIIIVLSGCGKPKSVEEIGKTIKIYPGSKMVFMEKQDKRTDAYFESKSTSTEILNFYKTSMKNTGWNIQHESNITLDFLKENRELMIEAVNCPEGKTMFTIYIVTV